MKNLLKNKSFWIFSLLIVLFVIITSQSDFYQHNYEFES